MKKFIILLISVMLISTSITAAYVTYAASIRDTSEIVKTQEEIALISSEKKELASVPKAPSITADIIDMPFPIEREVAGMIIACDWVRGTIVFKTIPDENIWEYIPEDGIEDMLIQDGIIVTINDNGTPWTIEDDIIVNLRYEDDYNYYFNLSFEEWKGFTTPSFTQEEIALCAGVIAHEAGSSWISTEEKACIVWAILNRVDDSRFPDTIEEVVNQPYQMTCYKSFEKYGQFINLAENVLYRHQAEMEGLENSGRILPKEYCYWWGNGEHNNFRITNNSYVYWDYSLESPYKKGE